MRPKDKIWKEFSLVERVTWIMMWDDVDEEGFEARKPIARKIIATVKYHLTRRATDGLRRPSKSKGLAKNARH